MQSQMHSEKQGGESASWEACLHEESEAVRARVGSHRHRNAPSTGVRGTGEALVTSLGTALSRVLVGGGGEWTFVLVTRPAARVPCIGEAWNSLKPKDKPKRTRLLSQSWPIPTSAAWHPSVGHAYAVSAGVWETKRSGRSVPELCHLKMLRAPGSCWNTDHRGPRPDCWHRAPLPPPANSIREPTPVPNGHSRV